MRCSLLFQGLPYLGRSPTVENMPVFIAAAKGDFWRWAKSRQQGSSRVLGIVAVLWEFQIQRRGYKRYFRIGRAKTQYLEGLAGNCPQKIIGHGHSYHQSPANHSKSQASALCFVHDQPLCLTCLGLTQRSAHSVFCSSHADTLSLNLAAWL